MPAGRPSLTAVIVDDVEYRRYLLDRLMTDAGFTVHSEPSGGRGLSRVRATHPDVVILDIGLPDIDGIEVCRQLKAEPACAQIPIVFVSATHRGARITDLVAASGADAFLTDAECSGDRLLNVVRTLMGLPGRQRPGSADPST